MRKFSVVIAAGAEPIRRHIIDFLKLHPEFEALAIAFDSLEAKEICQSMQADVLFICSELIKSEGHHLHNLPSNTHVVCFSNTSDFGATAFELNAVDFLICPVTEERFEKCITKLATRLGAIDLSPLQQIEHMLKQMQSQPLIKKDPLIVKDSGRIRIIEADDIMWIGGAGNYVELHLVDDERPLLHRETLNTMEKKLSAFGFIRIHRSAIVKKQFIRELKPTDNGDYLITLRNGKSLNLSRRYKESMVGILI